jgi:hypothetical protein
VGREPSSAKPAAAGGDSGVTNMQTTSPPPNVPVPRKSRRRWYLLGGFLLLFLAAPISYYFIAGWWGERQMAELERAIEEEDPNWRFADLLAAIDMPPDDQNAALQITKVHALLSPNNPFNAGGKWETSTMDYRNARLPNQNADPLRVAFTKVPKGALEEARKLKDMPAGHFNIKPEDNPFAMKLDYVQDSRSVANLLQLDVVMRSHDGDHDGAAQSCMALLNTANAMKDQPFLISQLVRCAEHAIAVAAIERTLGQGTVSEPTLRKLQTQLEAAAANDGLHQAMRGERAFGHQAYLNLRAGKMTLSELLNPSGMKLSAGDRLVDTFPGIILNGYPDYLRMMNEQVRASKLKDAERKEAYDKLDQQMRQNRARTFRGNLLISLIMPATTKVAQASQRTQAWLRCTTVAVAAERYRLKNKNTWPGSIEELVKADLLKEVPNDPFDGKPLRFKRTPTGVIVYSVGFDTIDNGGKLDRKNVLAPNTDLGFELFDRRAVPAPPDEELP